MRSMIIVLIFGIVVLFCLGHTVDASELNSVSFTFGYIHGSLEFPEEAHSSDTLLCNLTLAAYVDVTIYNFTLAVSGMVGDSWQPLQTEQILSYAIPEGGNLSRQITVVLPLNMSERLNYLMEASTDKGFGKTSFYATYVRAVGYDALLDLYNALLTDHSKLQTDYNQLYADYSALNLTHNSLQEQYGAMQMMYNSLESDYGSLNASYASLIAAYDSLQDNYAYIKTKYDDSTGELSIVRDLLVVFSVSTVVLAATTIYFRKKAPYIVLRKETTAKPNNEQ